MGCLATLPSEPSALGHTVDPLEPQDPTVNRVILLGTVDEKQ